MQNLKVALVLDDSLDTPDGVQQYVLAVGKFLSSQGHSVYYLVGRTQRTDIANIHSLGKNIKVRFNQNRMSIPLPVSKKEIKALLDREQFEVIHVQMPYSPMLGARIIDAAPDATAVVGTFHVAPHSKLVFHANRALRLLLGKSLKRFDQIISVSEPASVLAREAFHIHNGVIVPNTIDLGPFYAGKSFPEYDKIKTIVFLGRLVPRKGCGYLLRAAHYIEQHGLLEGTDWQVIVCGKGPLLGDLKEYIAKRSLENRVKLVGFISESDKPRYLASADVAVFPSTGGESFGIVLIEGFAASRGTVLGGNNPGYAAVLRGHPENLFDPMDEKAFAEILAANIRDEHLREKARSWQRELSHQYDLPVVGKQILDVYDSALHSRRR